MSTFEQPVPHPIRKLMIVGSPGSGKSTLARELATRLGLPLIHLDRLYWQPHWVEPTKEEWAATLDEALRQPAWIMDGNYGNSLTRRLPHADAVIALDYPTALCLWRAVKRVVTSSGVVRTDMAPDCPERFDAEFLRYICLFRKQQRNKLFAALDAFPGPKLILTAPRQIHRVNEFLLPQSSGSL
jgi:adenylate kinase family enzyme